MGSDQIAAHEIETKARDVACRELSKIANPGVSHRTTHRRFALLLLLLLTPHVNATVDIEHKGVKMNSSPRANVRTARIEQIHQEALAGADVTIQVEALRSEDSVGSIGRSRRQHR